MVRHEIQVKTQTIFVCRRQAKATGGVEFWKDVRNPQTKYLVGPNFKDLSIVRWDQESVFIRFKIFKITNRERVLPPLIRPCENV